MAEVSSFIEVLRLGGNYELVYQLWAQLTLSAVRVKVDVTWSRDEVLLLFPFVPYCLRSVCAFSLLPVLVHHSQWGVSSGFFSLDQLGRITWELLQRGIRRTRRGSAGFSSHLG